MPLEKGANTSGSGFFSWKYFWKLNLPGTNAAYARSNMGALIIRIGFWGYIIL